MLIKSAINVFGRAVLAEKYLHLELRLLYL
jgi:hypothetical protein